MRLEHFILRFPFGVVLVDRDLNVVLANARARSLLGRDATERGASFVEHAPKELRADAQRLSRVAASVRARDCTLDDITSQRRQDRVMREFLRNAAHQLRTPLAGITAAVEILQAGAKENPVDRDRFLAHVQRHADRLARVTRGLLLLARSQSGEAAPLDFVELWPLLEELTGEAEPAAGVAVTADCPPGLAALAIAAQSVAAMHGEIRVSSSPGEGTAFTVTLPSATVAP